MRCVCFVTGALSFMLIADVLSLPVSPLDPHGIHEESYEAIIATVFTAQEVIGNPINDSEVTFHLYHKNSPNSSITVDPSHLDLAANKNGRLFFLMHGWKSNGKAEWLIGVKNGILKQEPNSYVIIVDWERPADQSYGFAVYNTEDVGQLLAKTINKLNKEHDVALKQIVLLGHSLGGQICGWTAKKYKSLTKTKLHRIIALDPAGPLYISRPDDRRLNRDDAAIVHVVHTDAGKLGFEPKCGTIDFFPNGGFGQPGCISISTDITACSHWRGWGYFVEAVTNPDSFPAKKCSNWSNFKKNKCDEVVVNMGDLHTEEEGTFFLSTNSSEPYTLKVGEYKSYLDSIIPPTPKFIADIPKAIPKIPSIPTIPKTLPNPFSKRLYD